MKKLTQKQITQFQKTVWDYYHKHKRPMPWRSRVTPYRVLISEVMLQQTQVDRVIPKFNAWIKQFPNFQSLASAPLSLVLKFWSGLGYNRRAINVHKTAKYIVEAGSPRPHRAGAKIAPLPRTVDEWDTFPGIGPATAAAICVYAFNTPYAFIETNVRAVFIHHFFKTPVGAIHELPLQQVDDTDILPLVETTLDPTNPREWFWALMDYGTYLKKTYKNPSRRSAHHTKQSTFEGSNRQLRGKILKLLLAHTMPSRGRKFSTPTANEIAKTLNLPKQKVAPVVTQLIKDGFIINKNGKLGIT